MQIPEKPTNLILRTDPYYICLRQNLGEGQPQNCVLAYITNPIRRPSQNPFTLLEIYPDDPSVTVSVRVRIVTNGVVPNDLVAGETLVSTELNARGDTVSRYLGKKIIFNPAFTRAMTGDTICAVRLGHVDIRVFASRGEQRAVHDFRLHFENDLNNGMRNIQDRILSDGTVETYTGFIRCP